jgi:hypothetical protein
MEVLNKFYIRIVKEILIEPTRRFPHTSVSFLSTCHLQQGRTNPEYSIALRKTYPLGGKKKTPRICKAIWLMGYCNCKKHY